MIIPMTKYSFILLNADKEQFLARLQELGVVDITRSSKPVDEASRRILSDIADVKEQIKYITEGSDPELQAMLTRRTELVREIGDLSPWGDYDMEKLLPFGIHFFCTSRKLFDNGWQEQYALQTVCENGEKLWFVIVGDISGFPLKELPAPARNVGEAEEELRNLDGQIGLYRKKLGERKAEIPGLESRIRELSAELSLYLADVSGERAAEDSVVIFRGFAPTELDKTLAETFEDMDLYWIAEAATVEDNPPIKLKNNRFIKQFEPLTEMYGMPVYNEFDPTIFLSIFYLLFFAICMGDAGYGILLVLIGFFLRNRQGGLAKMWTLIVSLGIGTIVVGFLMGGFFGIDLSTQSWMPEGLKKVMITGDLTFGGGTYAKQMVMSLAIGIVHIALAMVTKAVWAIRRNGVKNSLSTLGWTLLIVGGLIGLAIGLTGTISETAMKWLLIGIAVVSALGIYVFNKWGRNPLVNIGAGLWDTYNMASGLMGDMLSYIRLYALGLSGMMLGQTFNLIAGMVLGTNPTWQWVPFLLIVILGHVLNLAMCCLGAFVHPLRLNFVEFFKNSGYEGQGTAYNPIRK